MTDKLCAQQTASLLSEKPGGFFDSLNAPPKRGVFHCPPHEKTLSLRGRKAPVTIRIPRPPAPLPKGGCRQGNSFPAPHLRQGTRALPYKNGCRAAPVCAAAREPPRHHGGVGGRRPTHYRAAGTTGPMWASAPTECLPIGFRRGRCPHRPAPGLAQSSLLSLGADASVRPLPNAPPQKRERPPGRSLLAYVFFTPPGNRLGLRPPAAGFSPGPAHPGVGR